MNRFLILLSALLAFSITSSCEDSVRDEETPEVKPAVTNEVKRKTYPKNEVFTILPDRVVQGEKLAIAKSPGELWADYYSSPKTWKLTKDISAYPVFSAPGFPLMETLYNMAIEEALLNILPKENAFMAGKQWTGIWTRDISYAIHLGLGMIMPAQSRNSLMAKVSKDSNIIQDTGTGGSWPVSSDRVVWAIAAYTVYLTTGDAAFLETLYTILKNTVNADIARVYDEKSGLYSGESSFMDWREQTYPLWMQPADIYASQSISTCVLHARALSILSEAGVLLKKPKTETDGYRTRSVNLIRSINNLLWMKEKNLYSSFRYGGLNRGIISDKTDNLGEALAVLFGVAPKDKASDVVAAIPVVPFGIPCIYPQQPHADSYHNKGIWPFVNAYYALAGAQVKNDAAVTHAFQSMIRAAALFQTHKENFRFDNGHSTGTAINSDRQLWSVGGYLALVYRVLFGMELYSDGLTLNPFVPSAFKGPFTLSNFTYRNAVLTVTVNGSGGVIESALLDGKPVKGGVKIPAALKGAHSIVINMKGEAAGKVNMVSIEDITPGETALTGMVSGDELVLSWKPVKGAVAYRIWKNGIILGETEITSNAVKAADTAVFHVQAVSSNWLFGNISAPYLYAPETGRGMAEAEQGYPETNDVQSKTKGFTGTGYVKLNALPAQVLEMKVTVPAAGLYLLRVRYGNGNGPINTDNKCAIRSVTVNGKTAGAFIMPQRGKWEDWGYSNPLEVNLKKGNNVVQVYYTDADRNMNGKVNGAVVDHLEWVLLK